MKKIYAFLGKIRKLISVIFSRRRIRNTLVIRRSKYDDLDWYYGTIDDLPSRNKRKLRRKED